MYSSLLKSFDDETMGDIVKDLVCFASSRTLDVICKTYPRLTNIDEFWIICIRDYYKRHSTNMSTYTFIDTFTDTSTNTSTDTSTDTSNDTSTDTSTNTSTDTIIDSNIAPPDNIKEPYEFYMEILRFQESYGRPFFKFNVGTVLAKYPRLMSVTSFGDFTSLVTDVILHEICGHLDYNSTINFLTTCPNLYSHFHSPVFDVNLRDEYPVVYSFYHDEKIQQSMMSDYLSKEYISPEMASTKFSLTKQPLYILRDLQSIDRALKEMDTTIAHRSRYGNMDKYVSHLPIAITIWSIVYLGTFRNTLVRVSSYPVLMYKCDTEKNMIESLGMINILPNTEYVVHEIIRLYIVTLFDKYGSKNDGLDKIANISRDIIRQSFHNTNILKYNFYHRLGKKNNMHLLWLIMFDPSNVIFPTVAKYRYYRKLTVKMLIEISNYYNVPLKITLNGSTSRLTKKDDIYNQIITTLGITCE